MNTRHQRKHLDHISSNQDGNDKARLEPAKRPFLSPYGAEDAPIWIADIYEGRDRLNLQGNELEENERKKNNTETKYSNMQRCRSFE